MTWLFGFITGIIVGTAIGIWVSNICTAAAETDKISDNFNNI